MASKKARKHRIQTETAPPRIPFPDAQKVRHLINAFTATGKDSGIRIHFGEIVKETISTRLAPKETLIQKVRLTDAQITAALVGTPTNADDTTRQRVFNFLNKEINAIERQHRAYQAELENARKSRAINHPA